MDPQTTQNFGEQPIYTPTSDEKTMAILAHVLGLLVSFLAPLIIYLVKKDESKFVSDHAKEALNFQITLFIVFIGLFITVIGIFLMWIPCIAALVFMILAAVKANEGKMYRYPLTIRFIK